jgi:hypothetical protein
VAHEGWGDGWAGVTVREPRKRLGRLRSSRRRGRRERRRRIIKYSLIGFGVFFVAVAVTGAFLVRDALRARDALEQTAEIIPGLEQRLRDDPQSAVADLTRVQSQARIAASATNGPHWALASRLPFVGDDVRAFRQIAGTVDSLAQEVLPQVSTVATSITPATLAPVGGRINLAPLIEHRDEIVSVDRIISAAIEDVRGISRSGVIGQVADAADTLEAQLEQVHELSATAARAAELLPPMLGADGPRDWLVLAQNNAEPRATGGIPGAILLLRADNGRVTIEGKATGRDFGRIDPPIATLTEDEQTLFGEGLVRFSQNLSMTPDFPRTGYLARALWQTQVGQDISGVMSIDPVGLGYLMRATGPVTLPIPIGDEAWAAILAGETDDDVVEGDEEETDDEESAAAERPNEPFSFTADNIADFLLNGIYLRYANPLIHDEIFADVAEAVFASLLGPDTDASAALDGLVTAANSGRLMVWSPDEAEQARIAGTVLSGELRGYRVGADGEVSPLVGVFQNLTLAGKQGWYLESEIVVGESTVRANGSQEFTVTVSFTNNMDPRTAADLPHYIIGNTDGTIRTNVLIYAPTDGTVLGVFDENGDAVSIASALHDGLHVGVVTTAIAPGQTVRYEVFVRSGPNQPGPVVIRATPGAHD